jgi:N,N-dimethylformamidase
VGSDTIEEEPRAMRLVGYSDRLSAAPGETIAFKVSSAHATYDADIVRLVHGDPNPLGPGLIAEVVETPISGAYPGRIQEIHTGSFITVADDPALRITGSVTIQAWIFPTTPAKGTQGLLAKWSPSGPAGFALVIEDGALGLWLADADGRVARIGTSAPLHARIWYFVAAVFDAATGDVRLVQEPCRIWPLDPSVRDVTIPTDLRTLAPSETSLLMAALPGDHPAHANAHYNGKIDRPRLFNRALSRAELDALKAGVSPLDLGEPLVAAWDFSREIASDHVIDASPNALHGTAVNLPARAMTGANWSGDESNFNRALDEYGAIHFHDDDLDDTEWDTDFTFTIPDPFPSGIYAARLRAGENEDHLPFVVRPPRGTAAARVAFLVPTFTYLAYANEHIPVEPLSLFPFADLDLHKVEYAYIAANHLNSLYDCHSDSSGVRYASWQRPLLNLRPNALFRIYGGTERLSADLYLTHWFTRKGIAYDTIADENLHEEGESLLAPYKVVVTGTHPEYWTRPMLDALDRYLDGGGRVMYLGGNGFYWVTGVDPERPHVIEIRRWRGTETWETEPGEHFLSTTGEQGGLWRNRNRAPQKRFGVGFTAQGNDFAQPYVRQPDSYSPRAAFIFEGVNGDVIGDFPSLMLRHGAAGYEIDRADVALGTPNHALILASATGFSDSYQHVVEEMLSTDDEQGGTNNPLVRADVVFFEGPNGGAVFSVGSIAWCSALSANDGDNDVSRITENVLRRFAADKLLPDEAPA